MFNLKNLVDYIKRRDLRLNVKLPVYFAVGRKSSQQIGYQKCFTSNISLGGISIGNLKMPSRTSKHLVNKTIHLQFRLPLRKRTIDADGLIEWDRIRTKKEIADNHMGIKFTRAHEHDILDLLDYGLKVAQLRTGAVLLAIIVVIAAGYGITAGVLNHSKQLVKEQLVSSEAKRQAVVREVEDLLAKKKLAEANLKANARQIEKQKALLISQETAIVERRSRIEILEEIFKLVSEEWDIERDSATVIVDQDFRDGRGSLKDRDYDSAITTFYRVLKTYPDSPLVYKMLYKALYLSGKKDEAERVYERYFELLKKDILQGG